MRGKVCLLVRATYSFRGRGSLSRFSISIPCSSRAFMYLSSAALYFWQNCLALLITSGGKVTEAKGKKNDTRGSSFSGSFGSAKTRASVSGAAKDSFSTNKSTSSLLALSSLSTIFCLLEVREDGVVVLGRDLKKAAGRDHLDHGLI